MITAFFFVLLAAVFAGQAWGDNAACAIYFAGMAVWNMAMAIIDEIRRRK